MNARRVASVDRPRSVIRQSEIDREPGLGRHLILLQRGKKRVIYARAPRLDLPTQARRTARRITWLGIFGLVALAFVVGTLASGCSTDAHAEIVASRGLTKRETAQLDTALTTFFPDDPDVKWRCRNESVRGPVQLVACEPSPKPGFRRSRFVVRFERREGIARILAVVAQPEGERRFEVLATE